METNNGLTDEQFDAAFAKIKITEDVINGLEISEDDKKILISMLDKSPEEIEKLMFEMMDRHLKAGTFYAKP